MSKYNFTQTELQRGILKLQCAASYQMEEWITDRREGDTTTNWRLDKIAQMNSVLFALERYNYTYYADDSINCLTIDEAGFLLQRANQLSGECGCSYTVRPVTLVEPHL